jgi:SAM-dependent methyltransferase
MSERSSDPLLSVAEGLREVGAELAAHGYSWDRVRARTGLSWQLPFPPARLDEIDTPHLGDERRPPLDWLIRLLLLGDAIPAARLDACLTDATRSTLESAGLLRERDGAITAEAMLLPWQDLVLACDWPWRDVQERVTMPDPSSALTAEHVAPLQGEPTDSAVDVGTGCGIIAFVAKRHFARVSGVDTNARAIGFARFNAALNACDVGFESCSAAFLKEELDAPVDLLTFVLPVLLPHFWRREAPAYVSQVEPGVDGKALACGVYRQLARVLRPGGRALLFHQVPLTPGDDLATWLRESGAQERLATVANMLYRRDTRFAFVRASLRHTREPGVLRFVPGPNDLFGGSQTRTDLVRHIETSRLLADDPTAIRGAVPHLYDWIEATATARVCDGALGPPDTSLDEMPLHPDAWAFAQALDGRSTVGELEQRSGRLDVEALTRAMITAGHVYLRKPR